MPNQPGSQSSGSRSANPDLPLGESGPDTVPERRFPATARIKTPPEFRRVFDRGHKVVGRYFVVFVKPRETKPPRLGLAVGRRVGNAVRRNRIKRLVRESFRHNQERLGARDIVVVARSSAENAPRTSLNRDLEGCWEKIQGA